MTDTTNNQKPAALHVAPGPHLQSSDHTTRKMMLDVIIALVPVIIVAIWVFKQFAAIQMGICVVTCLVAEKAFMSIRGKKSTLGDMSAILTGLIIALSLPWNAPWHVGVIASVIAMGFGKAIFGGIGFNLFNPAMVGRAFVMLAFSGALAAPAYVSNITQVIPDWTGATPLTAIKEGAINQIPSIQALFIGNTAGSLGETSAIACLLGGFYLCVIRRTASWQIPVGIITAAAVICAIVYRSNPIMIANQILGGALLFGAVFIATDPVTSPLTPKGKFIFGLGVGALIMMIRELSAYPEGVMFAVLLMNAITPLINKACIPVPFGGKPKPQPAK